MEFRSQSRQIFILLPLLLLVSGCPAPLPEAAPDFVHDVGDGPAPWSHDRFDESAGKFTFAVISDLNGGERAGVFEVAVAQLALLRPEFVVTVGDLIDGGTEDTEKLTREWRDFDARAAEMPAPIVHVGGNHDLTNVAMRDFWARRYGPRYSHFVFKNVLFLLLDSEDYGEERMREIYLARIEAIEILEGDEPEKAAETAYFNMPERLTGEIGDAQASYFEDILARNPDVHWSFLFMHKPVWLREDSHGLARIETALGDRPYTVFNGHYHNFSHQERDGRDYIMLGTTGGSQRADLDGAFDHITLVTVAEGAPSIAHLRLDGILDKTGRIPANGETLCFQASKCGLEE